MYAHTVIHTYIIYLHAIIFAHVFIGTHTHTFLGLMVLEMHAFLDLQVLEMPCLYTTHTHTHTHTHSFTHPHTQTQKCKTD